jgi:hypothetical protein
MFSSSSSLRIQIRETRYIRIYSQFALTLTHQVKVPPFDVAIKTGSFFSNAVLATITIAKTTAVYIMYMNKLYKGTCDLNIYVKTV